jgi:hypothetical protein
MSFRSQYRNHALTVRLQLTQMKNSLRMSASTGCNLGSLQHFDQSEKPQALRGPVAAWFD